MECLLWAECIDLNGIADYSGVGFWYCSGGFFLSLIHWHVT